MRKVAKSKIEAKNVFHLVRDKIHATYGGEWKPSRISRDYGDSKIGYINFTPFNFKVKTGKARKNSDGSITLYVHSNLIVNLRDKL